MKLDLEKQAKDIQRKLKNDVIGARDYGVYVNTLLKIQQQLESQSEGKFWKDLRELKEAFESLEEFDISGYKSLFEKKKKVLLA